MVIIIAAVCVTAAIAAVAALLRIAYIAVTSAASVRVDFRPIIIPAASVILCAAVTTAICASIAIAAAIIPSASTGAAVAAAVTPAVCAVIPVPPASRLSYIIPHIAGRCAAAFSISSIAAARSFKTPGIFVISPLILGA